MGLPWWLSGKESACQRRRYRCCGFSLWVEEISGEGHGNPLQYSWAPLVAQTVKNLLAMQETWVLSLGREDPLEKGMATSLPVSLPGEFHGQAPLSMVTLQARKLEWVAMPSSKGSSQPRDQTQISRTASRFFTV